MTMMMDELIDRRRDVQYIKFRWFVTNFRNFVDRYGRYIREQYNQARIAVLLPTSRFASCLHPFNLMDITVFIIHRCCILKRVSYYSS